MAGAPANRPAPPPQAVKMRPRAADVVLRWGSGPALSGAQGPWFVSLHFPHTPPETHSSA
jgi:hypothetical protein